MPASATLLLRFAATGALIAALLTWVSESLAPVYPEMKQIADDLESDGAQLKTIVVGNSHAYRSIDFPTLQTRGLNFARAGADFFESEYRLRAALDAAAAAELVLFSASFGAFTLDNGADIRPSNKDRRRELYARTPGLMWIDGDASSFVAGRLAPVMRPDHWQLVVKRLLAPVGVSQHSDKSPARTYTTRERIEQQRRVTGNMLKADPEIPDRAERALRAAVHRADRERVQLVFFTAPLRADYLSYISRQERDAFRQRMARVVGDSPCAVYFDFSDHTAFLDDRLFTNGDHLNEEGARVFSALLRQRLALHAATLPRPCAARQSRRATQADEPTAASAM